MEYERRVFRSSSVKLFINSSSAEQIALAISSGGPNNFNAQNTITENKNITEELNLEGRSPFAEPREEKLHGLKKGSFQKLDKTSIGNDLLLFGSNFVDQV